MKLAQLQEHDNKKREGASALRTGSSAASSPTCLKLRLTKRILPLCSPSRAPS